MITEDELLKGRISGDITVFQDVKWIIAPNLDEANYWKGEDINYGLLGPFYDIFGIENVHQFRYDSDNSFYMARWSLGSLVDRITKCEEELRQWKQKMEREVKSLNGDLSNLERDRIGLEQMSSTKALLTLNWKRRKRIRHLEFEEEYKRREMEAIRERDKFFVGKKIAAERWLKEYGRYACVLAHKGYSMCFSPVDSRPSQSTYFYLVGSDSTTRELLDLADTKPEFFFKLLQGLCSSTPYIMGDHYGGFFSERRVGEQRKILPIETRIFINVKEVKLCEGVKYNLIKNCLKLP